MNQKQNNTPSKEPTVMIAGETANYSVAYYIPKMTLNAASKLKHLFLNKDVTIIVKTKLFKSYITLLYLYNS